MHENDDLKQVVAFHGHLCPGIAYGYRAARAALDAFGDRASDEEIVSVVENDSCSVDAIQVMTGCTFGKGNLLFKDFGKQVYTFYKRATGEGLRISVDYSYNESREDKAVWDQFLSGNKSPDITQKIQDLKTKKVNEILSADQDQLLKIEKIKISPPPKAHIYPSIRCEQCGEKVMEARIQLKENKKLCIPCSGT
jgi:formylmethanofuran dehydrogenase subunit E